MKLKKKTIQEPKSPCVLSPSTECSRPRGYYPIQSFSASSPPISPSSFSTHSSELATAKEWASLPQTRQWQQPPCGCCSSLPLLSTTACPVPTQATNLPLHVLHCTRSPDGIFFSAALHRASRLLWWPSSKTKQSLLLRKKGTSLRSLTTRTTPTSGSVFSSSVSCSRALQCLPFPAAPQRDAKDTVIL
jgi:hypothetical protein